jgi:hypothetical protein
MGGAFYIGAEQVTPAAFFRHTKKYQGAPIRRARGPAGRKRALIASQPRTGCEHEYGYHEDWGGDPGVINGTFTICWLECDHCGAQRPASYEDRPCYDDYY